MSKENKEKYYELNVQRDDLKLMITSKGNIRGVDTLYSRGHAFLIINFFIAVISDWLLLPRAYLPEACRSYCAQPFYEYMYVQRS